MMLNHGHNQKNRTEADPEIKKGPYQKNDTALKWEILGSNQ